MLTRICFASAFLALACFGCASSSTPHGATDMGPSAAGAPMSTCEPGIDCTCDDGTIGRTQCIPSSSCECLKCPEVEPAESVEFQTCSGDVTGDWALESLQLRLEALEFTSVDKCP